jgi:prepilin-type N-terminal cleavage/methylation domain-containing protein
MSRHHLPSAHDPLAARGRDAGFTLVEVLVAIVVLTIGLLGTFAVLRTSEHTTLTNRERQAETSLAREVLEDAGSLPTVDLTSAALPGALTPLISGSTVVSGGLQVPRGPAQYTAGVIVCSLDDPSDGLGSHSAPPAPGGVWCPDVQPTPSPNPSPDPTPDDEERVSVTVQALGDPSGPQVQQSTLIFNHGLLAISCLTVAGGACPGVSQTVSYSATSTLTFSVTTGSQAASVQWLVDGSNPTSGQLTGGETDPYRPAAATSSFTWQLPQVPGTYTISAQAQDAQGNTGPPATVQIKITS